MTRVVNGFAEGAAFGATVSDSVCVVGAAIRWTPDDDIVCVVAPEDSPADCVVTVVLADGAGVLAVTVLALREVETDGPGSETAAADDRRDFLFVVDWVTADSPDVLVVFLRVPVGGSDGVVVSFAVSPAADV